MLIKVILCKQACTSVNNSFVKMLIVRLQTFIRTYKKIFYRLLKNINKSLIIVYNSITNTFIEFNYLT